VGTCQTCLDLRLRGVSRNGLTITIAEPLRTKRMLVWRRPNRRLRLTVSEAKRGETAKRRVTKRRSGKGGEMAKRPGESAKCETCLRSQSRRASPTIEQLPLLSRCGRRECLSGADSTAVYRMTFRGAKRGETAWKMGKRRSVARPLSGVTKRQSGAPGGHSALSARYCFPIPSRYAPTRISRVASAGSRTRNPYAGPHSDFTDPQGRF
jgi:hypothetical protein